MTQHGSLSDLTTKTRQSIVGMAEEATRRADEKIDRWRRRTTQRRRTVYLAVFLVAWFGSGAWVMHTWLTEGPHPAGGNGDAAGETSHVGTEPDQQAGTDAGSDDDSVQERLARWAEVRDEGWQTLAVQRDGSGSDRWRILGRTDNTPQNRVAVLTVVIAPDGTVELVDEQLP